uniref:ABC1 atypical kinase-like domain-containing protein n=1 Tax=Chenopodium quinoa TaxID=63459 RepID=A0A803NCW3_CHEQI
MPLLLRPPSPLPPLFHSFSGDHPKLNFNLSPKLNNFPQHRPTSLSASRNVDLFTQNSGYLFKLSDSEAESLSEYDIASIGSIYRRKPLILGRRLFQIGTTLGKWFGIRYIDGVMERADTMFKVRAAELRKILVELGPAYVKIAQAISSRSDLIPPSYLEELSVLQDSITPFSNKVAFSLIEEELGMPIDEIFSEISSEPVAAASLGQVYQARLRASGQAGKFNTDLQAVVDEWASSLFREMDYRKEANNGLKFRELYGVLIMEWIEGQKLAEVKDLYLVEVGVYCSFNQLLEYGFYHADPHPGNLLRTYDGKLAYLDFGMMGDFKEELCDGFIEACLHLVNRDFEALARDFVTLGLLPPTSERDAVTKALTGVFQNAVSRGIRNISFGDLLGDLGITMYKFKFQIPSYFSLVIRSLAVLEGIAISFDPNYKVLVFIYKDGVFNIERLESLLNEMRRARLDKTQVKKDEFDKKIAARDILSFTLAEQGSFVREIFLEETAKGLDALGIATINSIASGPAAYLPFPVPILSFPLTDEDVINLRNFRRIVLLVSGLQDSGV